MSVTDSLERFTLLSIGDGLVSQVRRSSPPRRPASWSRALPPRTTLGTDLGRQLLFLPTAMTALTGMLTVMALVPGLPMLPFLVLAGGTGAMAYALHKTRPAWRQLRALRLQVRPAKGEGRPCHHSSKGGPGEKIETLLTLDALQIELGYGLVQLARHAQGGRSARSGDRRAPDLCPGDGGDCSADPAAGQFAAWGKRVSVSPERPSIARGELMPGLCLAMNATNSKTQLKGVPTTEPVFSCLPPGSPMPNERTLKWPATRWSMPRPCSSRTCPRWSSGARTKS